MAIVTYNMTYNVTYNLPHCISRSLLFCRDLRLKNNIYCTRTYLFHCYIPFPRTRTHARTQVQEL